MAGHFLPTGLKQQQKSLSNSNNLSPISALRMDGLQEISKKIQSRSKKESKSKQRSVLERIPFIRAFYAKFRLFLSADSGPIDKKWGRFLPFCRWNAY